MKIFLTSSIYRILVDNFGLVIGVSVTNVDSSDNPNIIGTIDVKFAGEELNIPPAFNCEFRYLNDDFKVVTFNNKNYHEEALKFLISQEETNPFEEDE